MNGMIKKFYSGSDYRFLKEQAYVMFEEVSDGVYLVVKNRQHSYRTLQLKTFATSEKVVETLNYVDRVVVAHGSGSSGYGNWDFEIPKTNRRMM